jgi:hypothetical protein
MSEQFSSWRWTAEERRELGLGLAEVATAALGIPAGGAVRTFVRYFYKRRHLLFDKLGSPNKAYNYQGKGVRLATLARPTASSPGQLRLHIDLTQSALDQGLRNGDPVTVVLTGHAYVRTPSGLVVPARVGEPVDLAVPQGNYNLAAFGSRQDLLFTTPDPYTTLGGGSIGVGNGQEFAVPLTARPQLPPLGCNCPQCLAATAPVAGCNCPQCLAARTPVAGCSCPQCLAARNQLVVPGCGCPQCQATLAQPATRIPGCGCPQCRGA